MISYLLIFYQTQAIFFYYLITQKIITHHLPSLFQRRLKIRGRFFHLPRAFHNFFADECITIGRKGKKINRTHPIEPGSLVLNSKQDRHRWLPIGRVSISLKVFSRFVFEPLERETLDKEAPVSRLFVD